MPRTERFSRLVSMSKVNVPCGMTRVSKKIRIQIGVLGILLVLPRKICFQEVIINNSIIKHAVIMDFIILQNNVGIFVDLPFVTPNDTVKRMMDP